MSLQPLHLPNDDPSPARPTFTPEDNRAFGLGALIGLCFSLAVISAVTVALLTRAPKPEQHAWVPTVTVTPADQ